MKLPEAIEKVKHLKDYIMMFENLSGATLMDNSEKEAIDTVVSALEKPLPTDVPAKIYVNVYNPIKPNSWDCYITERSAIINSIGAKTHCYIHESLFGNDINATSKTYTAEDMEEFSHWYNRKVSVIGESELHLFGVRPFQDIIDYWEQERRAK